LLTRHSDNFMLMEEWLHGVAKVREQARLLELVDNWNELLNDQQMNSSDAWEMSYTPVQLPPRFNDSGDYDDQWVGVEFDAPYAPYADKLSLIVVRGANYQPEQPQVGLVIDEWAEVVPERQQTTGVTFHYDQPNSEPPQTMLLAVSPRIGVPGSRWDLKTLLEVVNETLDLAKKRAIEPDTLAHTHLAMLLPAFVAPTAAMATTNTLPFRRVNSSMLFSETRLNP
jgi:hypothetical protein